MIQACDKFRVMTQRVRVQIQDKNYLLLWGYKVTEPRESLEVSARTLWSYYVHVQLGGALGQTQIILEGLHIQSCLALPLCPEGHSLKCDVWAILCLCLLPHPRPG